MVSEGKTGFCSIVFAQVMVATPVFMHKIGARDNPYCNCGNVQTPQHVLSCNVIGITGDIINVDEEFRNWFNNNALDI